MEVDQPTLSALSIQSLRGRTSPHVPAVDAASAPFCLTWSLLCPGRPPCPTPRVAVLLTLRSGHVCLAPNSWDPWRSCPRLKSARRSQQDSRAALASALCPSRPGRPHCSSYEVPFLEASEVALAELAVSRAWTGLGALPRCVAQCASGGLGRTESSVLVFSFGFASVNHLSLSSC